jgi:hypothetical protein
MQFPKARALLHNAAMIMVLLRDKVLVLAEVHHQEAHRHKVNNQAHPPLKVVHHNLSSQLGDRRHKALHHHNRREMTRRHSLLQRLQNQPLKWPLLLFH